MSNGTTVRAEPVERLKQDIQARMQEYLDDLFEDLDFAPHRSVWYELVDRNDWSEELFARFWEKFKARMGPGPDDWADPNWPTLFIAYLISAAANAGDLRVTITPVILEDDKDEPGALTEANLPPLEIRKDAAFAEGQHVSIEAWPVNLKEVKAPCMRLDINLSPAGEREEK